MFAQFSFFLSVGAVATLLQYALTAGFVVMGWLSLVPASTVAFLLSAAFNYWANARGTFRSQSSVMGHRAQQLRFAAVVALGCFLNAALLYLAVLLGLHAILGQLVATVGVLLSNFTLCRLWVFQNN